MTTPLQRDALCDLYPALPVFVRPNGLDLMDVPTRREPAARSDARVGVLRLAHFGSLYEARLDVRPFLARLAEEGSWRRIELTQFGPDWRGALDALPASVDVCMRQALPWPDVVACVQQFDAALVVGNSDPAQLPSKVVSYLGLPIPRIAVTGDPEADAIAAYLRDKSGWLVLRPDAPDVAHAVRHHVSRMWRRDELAPPRSESWEAVAESIAAFVLEALGRQSGNPGCVPHIARAAGAQRLAAPARSDGADAVHRHVARGWGVEDSAPVGGTS